MFQGVGCGVKISRLWLELKQHKGPLGNHKESLAQKAERIVSADPVEGSRFGVQG